MKSKQLKAFAIGAAIFAIGLGGFFGLSKTKPTATVQEVATSAWRVSAQTLSLADVSPVFNGFGTVENPDTQIIKARLTTDVAKVWVREGARVDAGTALLTLDAIDAEIKLSQAKANLADARANLISLNATEEKDLEALTLDREALTLKTQNLERIEDLRQRQLASQQQLDEARQALVTQKLQVNRRELALATVDAKRTQLETAIERFAAEVRNAERDLASTDLSAPEDGQIVAVHVVQGDRVQANQNLVTFAPNAGREVRMQVPEVTGRQLANALSQGTPIAARTPSGDVLALTRVAGKVSEQTGSLDVFFSSQTQLPPTGSVLSLSIELAPKASVAVLPTDALYGGDSVYRITNDNRLEAVPVERLGRRPGALSTEILVRSPELKTGDRILISRLPAAVTGLAVEVIE